MKLALSVLITVSFLATLLIASIHYEDTTRSKVFDSPESVGYYRQIPEPMVLSLSYWEQTANALKNLFDLQCWASTVNISKVVMPAIEAYDKSVFHFGLSESSFRFTDLFDLEYWNSMSLSLGYATLVSQQHFLQHASREIVYVQILNGGKCLALDSLADQQWYKFLTSHQFNISKIVCIDFKQEPSHTISKGMFQQKIFDGTAGNVTLLFSVWQGIRRNYRVAVNGSNCDARLDKIGYSKASTFNFTGPAVPSKPISLSIHHFLSQYIPGGRYIAIMLRTEKLFRNRKYIETASIPPEINPCVHDIVSDWKAMISRSNLSETLFFSDIGAHGSMEWGNPSALKFSQYIHNKLQFGFPLSDVNSALENMTKSNDSVQMAVLHQQLVAHATCVVIVGGGSFQTQTFSMYTHKRRGQGCYTVRGGACEVLKQSFE